MDSWLLFHSKAKKSNEPMPSNAARILSNFSLLDVSYQDKTYRSIEHVYHASKFSYRRNGDARSDLVEEIRNLSSPQEAKVAGGKKGMKKRGVELDVELFDSVRDDIMKSLVKDKITRHSEVQDILRKSKEEKIELLHHSRSDMYWGCHVDNETGQIRKGRNRLGEIYMEFIEQGLHSNVKPELSQSLPLKRSSDIELMHKTAKKKM